MRPEYQLKWRTEFTPHAKRRLRSVDARPAKKILDCIAVLQRAMEGGDLGNLDVAYVKLSGTAVCGGERQYRLAVADYRVIYRCDPEERVILVDEVGDRKHAYRNHGGRS